MKKISMKIVLAIVLCSSLLLVASGFITTSAFSKIVNRDAIEELGLVLEKETLNFENETSVSVNGVQSLNGIIQSTLDMSRLEDSDYLEIFKSDLYQVVEGIAENLDLINVYFYFTPEICYNGEVALSDYDGDGVYQNGEEYIIAEQDHSSSELDWYNYAIKDGTHWTDPYFYKARDLTLISYVESVVIDGKVVGVVGTDIIANDLIERFKTITILENGRITLFNEDFTFIADEEFTGQHMSQVDPVNYEKMKQSFDNGVYSGHTVFDNNGTAIYIFFKQMSNGWVMTSGVHVAEVFKELNQIQRLVILIIFIGVVSSGLIAFLLGRSISRPIVQIAGGMKELSSGEGDLTKKIEVHSKDETFLLAGNFNLFIGNLKEIVTQIKRSSDQSEQIGSSLNNSSSNAASAAIQISNNVGSIENQIRKLNENVMDTSSGIGQINGRIIEFKDQIGDQVSAVEESSASIEEMIASLNNVSTVTNNKLESTRKLVETTRFGEELLSETSISFKEGIADKIDNIKDMVNTISNISSRTNLLALNAAIEAAHAGESGKGFAVVADEIRKMAEEAAESSTIIEEIIKTIVIAIEKTDSNVDKTSKAFTEIFRESDEINRALNEIAANTVELSSGGQEILKAVALLNETTGQISRGIEEIESGSEGITSAIGNVNDISGQVYSGVQEISSGVNEVSSSFEEVSELAKDLDREARKLSSEVNRFII